jgi:lipopolysaccharide cholinephosphotransferase
MDDSDAASNRPSSMETVDQNIRQTQLKCIEILDLIDDICRREHIRYSLCGGSVIGAHLYKGCLPWDDDIDVMMVRPDYERFQQVAPALLPEGFHLESYQQGDDFRNPFSKVVNDNTTYVQKNGEVYGIFVDITVYDRVPLNALRWIDVFLYKRMLMVMRGVLPGRSLKNRIRTWLLGNVLSNRRHYLMWYQRVVERLGRTKHYGYSELFGAWANTFVYRPSVFENYSTIAFEGKQYMIVRDYLEYLETRYQRTDFHEPAEKQVPPHHVFVDFNMPYRQYLAQRR